MIRSLAFLTAVLCGAPASAQVPIVVKAGMLVDVESGAARSNQLLLIEGDRFKAIGATLAIPAGAKVIDLSRATVLPGLIDAHSHLLSNHDGGLGGDDVTLNVVVTQMNAADRALLGAAMAREALEAGITTVRDLGNSGWNADVALRNGINNGWVVGPRMAVSTRALAPLGGQFSRVTREAQSLIEQEFAQVTGVDDARRAVRQAVFDGADWIKVIAEHGGVALAPDELKAIVDTAHAARRKVAVHAMSDRGARVALEAGADSIEHGWFLSDDVLKAMAEKKTFLVPTDASWDMWLAENPASPYAAQNKATFGRTQKRLKSAVDLGVPVAAGSDVYYRHQWPRGVASIMRMVRSFRDAGVLPIDIVRAATIRAAELMGWQDRAGSIKEGKFADLIAVQADPLQDITVLENVAFVMKGGRVIKNDLAR
jgi:imidazolonepropionase-like amidohydrolase